RTPRLEGARVDLEAGAEIVRMHIVGPATAKFLLHRATNEVDPPAVQPGARLVRAAHPNHDRRVVRERAESLLAGAQRELRRLPGKRVAEDLCYQLQAIHRAPG